MCGSLGMLVVAFTTAPVVRLRSSRELSARAMGIAQPTVIAHVGGCGVDGVDELGGTGPWRGVRFTLSRGGTGGANDHSNIYPCCNVLVIAGSSIWNGSGCIIQFSCAAILARGASSIAAVAASLAQPTDNPTL